MTQSGTVKSVDGNFAVVEILRDSACAGCSSAHSCIGCKKKVRVRALNSASAEAGDTVCVETPTRRVIFYAFCVFLLPLIAAVAAYCTAVTFTVEKYALLWALGGFIIPFVFVFFVIEAKAKKQNNLIIIYVEKKGETHADKLDDTI
ncbi:MAG: SoxR reducing system RseC family protein [Clostridia bacterium]|nr:SoxR reducing system RseC family protein [Clostridia bacterium]